MADHVISKLNQLMLAVADPYYHDPPKLGSLRKPPWSDPRTKFVFVIHKHLFVFVRVIQFVRGPKIILFASTKVVHVSEKLYNHPP